MRKCYLMCRGIKTLALLLLFSASSISSMLAPGTVRRMSASKMKKGVPASKRLIGMPAPQRIIGMAAPINQPVKSNVITYGSVVRLRHKNTGKYFAATTKGEKTKSSYQNALYLVGNKDGGTDNSTLFTIKHLHDTLEDNKGLYGPIRNFDRITFKNIRTKEFIHSHDGHASPSSEQQEVTMYGGRDENDHWEIRINDDFLRKGAQVTLRHLLTGRRLHSHVNHWFRPGKQEATAYESGDVDSNDDIIVEFVKSIANHPDPKAVKKFREIRKGAGFVAKHDLKNFAYHAPYDAYKQPSVLDLLVGRFRLEQILDGGLPPRKQGIHLDNNLFLVSFNPMYDQRGCSLFSFQDAYNETATDYLIYGGKVIVSAPYSWPLDMNKSSFFHSLKYMSETASEETMIPSNERGNAVICTIVSIIEGVNNGDPVSMNDVFEVKVEHRYGLKSNDFLAVKQFDTEHAGLIRSKIGGFFSLSNVNPEKDLDEFGKREFEDAKIHIKSLIGEAKLKKLEQQVEDQLQKAKKAEESRIEKTIKSLERKIKQSTEKLRKARIRSKSRTVKKSKSAIRKNKAEIRKETTNLKRLKKRLENVIKKQVEDKKQKIIGLSEGAKKAITEIGTAYKAEQEIYARKGMPAGFLTPSRYEGVIARQVVFGQPIRTLRKSRRSKKKRYIVNVPALTLESNKAGKGKKLVLYFKGRRTVIYKGTKKIIDKITIGQDGIVYGFVGSNLYRLSRSVPQLLKTTAKNAAKKKSSKRRRTRRRKSRRRSKRSKKRLSRKRSRRTRRSRVINKKN